MGISLQLYIAVEASCFKTGLPVLVPVEGGLQGNIVDLPLANVTMAHTQCKGQCNQSGCRATDGVAECVLNVVTATMQYHGQEPGMQCTDIEDSGPESGSCSLCTLC
jgi:hypothetical protein